MTRYQALSQILDALAMTGPVGLSVQESKRLLFQYYNTQEECDNSEPVHDARWAGRRLDAGKTITRPGWGSYSWRKSESGVIIDDLNQQACVCAEDFTATDWEITS